MCRAIGDLKTWVDVEQAADNDKIAKPWRGRAHIRYLRHRNLGTPKYLPTLYSLALHVRVFACLLITLRDISRCEVRIAYLKLIKSKLIQGAAR